MTTDLQYDQEAIEEGKVPRIAEEDFEFPEYDAYQELLIMFR